MVGATSEPSEAIPKGMQAKYDEVVSITDAFFAEDRATRSASASLEAVCVVNYLP